MQKHLTHRSKVEVGDLVYYFYANPNKGKSLATILNIKRDRYNYLMDVFEIYDILKNRIFSILEGFFVKAEIEQKHQ